MAPGDGVYADTALLRQYGAKVLAAIQAAAASPGFGSDAATAATTKVLTSFKHGSYADTAAGERPAHVARALNNGYVGAMKAARDFWQRDYSDCAQRASDYRSRMAASFVTLGKGSYYCASRLEGTDGLNADEITGSVLRDRKDPTKTLDPKRTPRD